jgi:hypothetical protein
MKVVTFLTWGWIVGRTWMPEELGRVSGVWYRRGVCEDIIPVADEADVTPTEVDFVVPVRSVQKHALVLVDAGDGRPCPVVQDAGSVDENVAVVVNDLPALEVFDLYIVAALLLVPDRTADLVSCLDVFMQPILPRKIVEVCKDLLGASIHGAPIQLRLKRPRVVVRRHVTCAAAKASN